MQRDIKLYNMVFPIWMLWLFLVTWLIVLPANLLIDGLVLALTFKYLKITEIKAKLKSVIIKTWLFGFLADILGTMFMFLAITINFDMETEFGRWWYERITSAVAVDPFNNIYSILWVAACVLISMAFIFIFNYKIALKNLEVDDSQRLKLALSVAVFTAPYIFFLPTIWFI